MNRQKISSVLVRLCGQFLSAGISEEISLLERNAIFITNIGILIAQITNTLILLGTPVLLGRIDWFTTCVVLAAILLYSLAHYLISKKFYFEGRVVFSCELVITVSLLACYFGTSSGFQFLLVPVFIGSMMIWPGERHNQLLMASLVFCCLILINQYVSPLGFLQQHLEFKSIKIEHINEAFGILITFIVVLSLVISTEKIQETLDTLRSKAEKLATEREEQMLASLNALALARDNETGNHILRTQYYVKAIAERLFLSGKFKELNPAVIDIFFRAAPLHDVGKIGIPDRILLKPGKLDGEEWEIMKTHTLIGESVLRAAMSQNDSAIETPSENVINVALQIAGCHHERWDGCGYPRGLKGNQIPLAARIMSVADTYDALISQRVYKKAWSHSEAIKEILDGAGTRFDPRVVEAFLLENQRFEEIAIRLKDHDEPSDQTVFKSQRL